VRTFRTYATSRSYPLSAPTRALKPKNPQVSQSQIQKSADNVLTQVLFDTLIVRSFMTPSIAALLGRWFWWPLGVRPRPASQMLRPYGPRPAVRELLHRESEDDAVP
jgi:hypothetical protein